MQDKQYAVHNPGVIEEIRGNKQSLKTMKTGKQHTKKTLWYTAKAVLREKFIVIQAYLKIQEKPQTNSLILHLTELGKRTNKTKGK